jgi:hypothetical protein
MTQVDLGSTAVGRFDSTDSAISANDANKKPGSSQCPAVTALRRRAPVVTFTAAGVPSGEATLAGAPPAARHWPPGQPHVAEQCHLHRACTGHRGDITNSQPTSRDYLNKSPFVPRARTLPPELRRPP